jgi:hypothetical protein
MRRLILVFTMLFILVAGAGWLSSQDRQAKGLSPIGTGPIPGYPCYRSTEELDAALLQIVSDHPQISQLVTIGHSYKGRPLKVVSLTNTTIPGPKPVYFLMANIHSREVITAETAFAFIDYLTDRYETDPEINWLIDRHNIQVLVNANPDGHVQVEQGGEFSWWQKNNHDDEACMPPRMNSYPGVDLNQNFPFHWIPALDTCLENYVGTKSASEFETQAIRDYLSSLFIDYRGREDADIAMQDASGILISLHSPGEQVTWPWSWSRNPAPNAPALSLLGRKLANLNGCLARQASDQGIVTGTVEDWLYGDNGIASYTFQIGPKSGGFYPGCDQMDGIIKKALPGLVYAAKVARTPYLTSQGPVVDNIKIEAVNGSWHLEATLSDVANGGDTITAGEYYIDSDPWRAGAPYPLQANDGAYDEVTEIARGPFPESELVPGKHLILVRGKDSTGNWGAPSAIFFTAMPDSAITGQVSAADHGLPVPGAQITFRGTGMTAQVETDGQGLYNTAIYPGYYTATVMADGYSPLVQSDILVDEHEARQNFSLTPLSPNFGLIRGVVRDQGSYHPLAAQVGPLNTPWATTSDGETGIYMLEMPAGVYTITVSADGYIARTIPGVTVSAGTTTNLDIDMAANLPGPVRLWLPLIEYK